MKRIVLKNIIVILFLVYGKFSFGQGFQCYITNDILTSSNVFEFDVFIKDTSQLASPGDIFLLRTVQHAFTINPAFAPVGTPVISITNSGFNYYPPGLISYNNSPTLSAFQAAQNSAGTCATQGPILHNGDSVLVAHWRIAYPVGTNFNCVPHNLSMVIPSSPTVPGGNVNLRFAITKWTSTNCLPATSTTISNSGRYTSQTAGTLLNQMNNSRPIISNPLNVTIDECTPHIVTFSVSVTNGGFAVSPSSYQWLENGIPLSNVIPYAGVNTSQLTILYPSIAMNQNAYSVVVTQCNVQTSASAILTITGCPQRIDLNLGVFIEGFYLGNGQMNASVDPLNNFLLCDTLFVELRNQNYPYAVMYSDTGTLNIYGFSAFSFPNSAMNNSYYLVVHHRNSIETWSAAPVLFNNLIMNYFFDAPNKAFGNNLKDLGDGNYAMYSGDISDAFTYTPGVQDGIIESADYAQMEVAVYFLYNGYVVEDITGDRIVESADYSLMETNVYYTVHSLHP